MATTTRTYSLTVIRLEELQWKHPLHGRMPELYVEAKLGESVRETRTVRDRMPSWSESLSSLGSDDTATLRIKVKHKSSWSSHLSVGVAEIKLVELLGKCTDAAEAPLELLSTKRGATTIGRIIVGLEAADATSTASTDIAVARRDVQRFELAHPAGASDTPQSIGKGIDQVERQGELYRMVGVLLGRLERLKTIMDALSEIHPFVRAAWMLTSAFYNAVRNIFEADRKIIELVQAMADAFEFVQDVQKLPARAATVRGPIDGLLKQTIECCIFIRRYTSHGFVGRMLQTGGAQKIGELRQSLGNFKREIDSGVALHTAFVSIRATQGIDKLLLHQFLNPSQFSAFDRPVCLPGTRLEIIDEIIRWVFSETTQNIFWLYGVAGSGKSTVSTTIASHFRQMSRLGAYLFFERGKSEPSSVIRTIAYKLALHDPLIGAKIVSEVTNDHDIIGASSIDQFNKLLLNPLSSVEPSNSGPVLVILDALEECGTPETRRGLLELLRNEFLKLPNGLRFLITSRREADLNSFLSYRHETVQTTELDYDSDVSRQDVLIYLRSELDAVRDSIKVPEGWPWDENVCLLGKAAGGLFIWAATAAKMIKDSDDPFFHFDSLISDSRLLGGNLTELYATALCSSGIDWKSRRSKERFGKVMSLLIFGKIPMIIQAMDDILGLGPHESSELILSRLRSLVAYRSEGVVSLLHSSFSDFLTSSEQSSESWFIDISAAHHFITERCFAVMKGELRFNMCDLKSSFVRNDDIPDLSVRIESRIPPHLKYACLFWAAHLVEAPHSSELLALLSDFAYRQLLFWFEVLSVSKTIGHVAPCALFGASRWSEQQESTLTSFLQDAEKLVSMFGSPIVESTPHIYISMIPFFEVVSDVASHYSKCMSSTVRIEKAGFQRPLCLKVLAGHTSLVNTVAFSPNGRHIASASYDETVRVWDIDSGSEVFKPLPGSTACFSPDGSRIVSDSDDGTLRIWDACNGNLVIGLLEGHEYQVSSIAWSPDGTKIASGSWDNNIIIWDAINGKAVSRLCGHYGRVTSVSFSADSSRLVSVSWDKTVRIWHVKSGEPAFRPFEGHTDWVNSVAFSPDSRRVVSGSRDSTIKIWEVESGSVISTLEGHTWEVTSVAYSRCGTRIVSSSFDKTVLVWDVESGGTILGSFEGHSGWVNSVAFSQNGRFVASGSWDKTVRIWDASTIMSISKASARHTNVVLSVAFSQEGNRIASASSDHSIIVWDADAGDVAYKAHGHTDRVACVVFSPDRSRLLSGSSDKTIRIWDVQTGESVCNPLVHEDDVSCIAVSSDGAMVASGSIGGKISIWSIATGRIVAGPLHGRSGQVFSVAFSSDGGRLASGFYDATITVWNTASWKAVSEPLAGHSSYARAVCFSPDGSRIASGSWDHTIIVWDAESGEKVAGPFEGHTEPVEAVIFSSGGKHVISGSLDKTIRVWNLESQRTVCILDGHTDWVRALDSSPDGRRIISGSNDKTIRMWDLSDVLLPSAEQTSTAKATSPEWVLGEDGWILGGQDRRDLLMWVPPDLRGTLWRPRNTSILNCVYSTRLDFEGAAVGERWTECFSRCSESRT